MTRESKTQAHMSTVTARRRSRSATTARLDTFAQRVSSMLKLDFYRLFHTPLLYIMVACSAIIPAMVLSMTSANQAADAQTFDNTWQVVEMVAGANAGMDLMGMELLCNINMVVIFVAILVSIFVSHDYSSGFIKNVFAVHAKEMDYIVSKSAVGIFCGACMVVAYVFGACIAGLIAGKSFALGAGGVVGLVFCILSKAALMGVFVPLYVAVAVLFKQRLWLTIMGAFIVGILFYPVAMMSAPLNSSPLNLVMCLAGAVMLGCAAGAVGNLFLRKRGLA